MSSNSKIFETMFHSATEGILIVNKSGVIVKANAAAHKIFGYSDSLEDKPIEILLPEEIRKVHESHRTKYSKEPKTRAMGQGLDLYGRHHDGKIFPVEVSLSPSEVDGNPVVIAFVIDITERKLAEHQLREYSLDLEIRVEERTRELHESQKLYSAIARNFPDGMISVFDRDLRYVFVEGKELYALGITSEMLIGTRYMDRLAPEIAAQTEKELKEVFAGTEKSIDIKFKKNFYVLEAVPIPDEKGSIKYILVIEKNITQRKEAEEQVQRALQHERELSELKSRFVSTASHEFRTPLSTILSSVSLLSRYKEAGDEEKRAKHIQRIKGSVHNLTGILNDFLSLDKLETGMIEGNPVDFNLMEFVQETCDQMVPTLKKSQTIEYQHHGATDIYLDKQILNNILINLLSNASKYSDDDVIEVNTVVENGQLKIAVRDHGMGISVEDQKNLFQRFFRSKSAINIPGTGLGLNIVKKYVNLLEGTIEVVSSLGEGSTFTVKIKKITKQ